MRLNFGVFMKQFHDRTTVEWTGVIAWATFAFGAIKFVSLFFENQTVIQFGIYNVVSVVAFFYVYLLLKCDFNLLGLLKFLILFNAGYIIVEFLYANFIYLRFDGHLLSIVIMRTFSNFLIIAVFYWVFGAIKDRVG